ncbi:MAG: TonB-dependent receptor [Bacteroidales bacterium]|nr:TonB-dependent receptor [Bacteroidales bacterium]
MKKFIAALAAVIFTFSGSIYASAVENNSAAETAAPEKVKVSGQVVDEAGIPVIGIAVISSDGTTGTITTETGHFYLTVPADDVLTVTGIGYQDEKVSIAGKTELLIIVKTDSVLEEAVLVGFGTQRKESVIGAIASIAPETLQSNQTANISNALAGQIPGIIAVQRSGEPGYDASDFWIRGINTFGASSNPLVIIDGVERSLDQLSPEEIESFSVLKDASATAIYGVRGANGAIVIKTKRGSVGKAKVNVKADFGVTAPIRMAEYVDGAKHMEVVNAAAALSGLPYQPYSDERIEKTRSGVDTDLYPSVDWLDAVTNDFATTSRISADISGGTELLRYRFILGVYNEAGIIATDPNATFDSKLKLTKYNVRSNIDLNVTKSTLFTFSIGGYMQDRHAPGSDVNSILSAAIEIPPIVHPTIYSNGQFPKQNHRMNPYVMATQTGYKNNYKSQLQSVATIDQDFGMLWDPLEGLHLKVTFSFDVYQDYWAQRTRNPSYYIASSRDENGELITTLVSEGDEFLGFSKSYGGNRSTYFEVPLSYSHKFGKHNVDALLLWNMRSYVNQDASAAIYSFPYRNSGLAGRAAYDYDSRYFAEFNFGYNGSENFAKGYRYGFFPSGALGWMISNESFMQDIKHIVNQLRLRGSYGLSGNDKISDSRRFGYLTTINGNSGGHSFGYNNAMYYTGVMEDQFGIPDLTWETATKTNIGIDLGLFKSLNLTVDYFTELRSNIFMQRKTIPETAGYQNAPYANYGKVFNSGIDASLTFNRQLGKHTYLSIMGNFTYAHNEILEYDESAGLKNTTRAHTGYSIKQNYGLVADGLYTEEDFLDPVKYVLKPGLAQSSWGTVKPGDIKYRDLNNDGILNDEDITAIGGTSDPEIIYGFGFSFNHKGFDISALFQGMAKVNFIIGGNSYYIPGSGSGSIANILANCDDRWTPENPSQDVFYPRLSYGISEHNTRASTWWLKDGSFLRLKNFEMGYTFLKDRNQTNKVLSHIRLFVRGTNLFTLSSFKLWDPELGGSGWCQYPISRMLSIGLDVSFK